MLLHSLRCKWRLKTGIQNQALPKGKEEEEEQPSPAERLGFETRPA